MQKLVALLVIVVGAFALPSPDYQPRCSKYTLANNWDPTCLADKEYVIVASTPSGSVLSWNNDCTTSSTCDGFFSYGTECCGTCTYVKFVRIPSYTDYCAYTMIQYSYNQCIDDYNIVENFFGQAYADNKLVYRSFNRNLYTSAAYRYSDLVDPNFISYTTYANDYSYSIGVLDYCKESDIVILVVCNNFNYITYDNYPVVLVMAQKTLNVNEKKWVQDVLAKNNLNYLGLNFRSNLNCKPRCDYKPRYYY